MATGRTQVQSRNEVCETVMMLTYGALFLCALIVLVFAVGLHTSVHSSNNCEMTYMFRKLQFVDIPLDFPPSKKYSLSIYNEGNHWWERDTIEPGQIPVLFIPGSQGSAKQARSLASVLQNKTESRRTRFSFRFFAVDFDEEMTFLNGNILNRQLDFVMVAIRQIEKMMSVPRKIVLVGHSYGGLLAALTSIHKDYQNATELVITKGAPLNKSPILVDWMSLRVSLFFRQQWNKLQATELSRIGVVAYSGGLRDFQIQDEWSSMPNITHRPVWAIDGASDLGCDHLAILWCNELVRHVSRLLFSYAENLGKLSGREVVRKFYREEISRNIKRANLTQHVSELPSKDIKLGEKYKDFELKTKQTALILKPARYQVMWIRVNASCVNTMTTVRYDESMMHFQNASSEGFVETWIYRAKQGEKVRLVVDVTPPCKVDIQMTYPMAVNAWRFYEMMFSNLREVGGTFIVTTTFLGLVLRESVFVRSTIIALCNFAAIVTASIGCSNTSNTVAIPLTIGYAMGLTWTTIVVILDSVVISRLKFITRGHRALKSDHLFNGLFLISVAVTVSASSEGIMVALLLLSYRLSPRAVLLVVPAIAPHLLKLLNFRIFSIDNQTQYGLLYHPGFYAACIYGWGLMGKKEHSQVTMRCLMYGLTPALLYLLSSPLELFSAYSLMVLAAARFVFDPARKTTVAPVEPALAPAVSPRPPSENRRITRSQTKKK